jgi:hypothetical protein
MVNIFGMEDMFQWSRSAHFGEHEKAFARIDLEQTCYPPPLKWYTPIVRCHIPDGSMAVS